MGSSRRLAAVLVYAHAPGICTAPCIFLAWGPGAALDLQPRFGTDTSPLG